MLDKAITISRLDALSDADADALTRLVGQLSSSAAPDVAQLRRAINGGPNSLYCARNEHGEIVGMLSLVVFDLPTGVRAWIEDVVVEETERNRGIAAALVEAAFAEASERGVRTIDLTSRPSREAANRLYVRLGFERRETNVYRCSLQ